MTARRSTWDKGAPWRVQAVGRRIDDREAPLYPPRPRVPDWGDVWDADHQARKDGTRDDRE